MGVGIPFPGRQFLVGVYYQQGLPCPLPDGSESKNLQELTAAWQDYPADVTATLAAWNALGQSLFVTPPASTLAAMVAQFGAAQSAVDSTARALLTTTGNETLATPPVYPSQLSSLATTLAPIVPILQDVPVRAKEVASRCIPGASTTASVEQANAQLTTCGLQLEQTFTATSLGTLSTQFNLTTPANALALKAWLDAATIPVGDSQVAASAVCSVSTGAVVSTLSTAPASLASVQTLLGQILAWVNANAGGSPVSITGSGAPFGTLTAWKTAQGF